MVRKKVTSNRKTRPVKRTNIRTKYFAHPVYEPMGAFLGDPESKSNQAYYFGEKALKPAYEEFIRKLDDLDTDEKEQRRIIADYAIIAEHIGSKDIKSKILKKYLNEFGEIKWEQFKADARRNSNLFDPLELGRIKTLADAERISRREKGPFRRLVCRNVGIAVIDKVMTVGADERIKMHVQTGDGEKLYAKLMGPIDANIPETTQERADKLFTKGLGTWLRSDQSALTESDRTYLKRIYKKPLADAYTKARENPESFKEKVLHLKSVAGLRLDEKKLFYHVTGEPWSDPESMKDVGEVSDSYDKDLALAFNEALGLSAGSINPMAIGAAIKWGHLKKEHGMKDADVVKESEGKDLEAKYIHKGTEKLGKQRSRTKALEKRAQKMGWKLVGLDKDGSYGKSTKKKKTGSGMGSRFSTSSSRGSPSSKPASGLFSKKNVKISPTGQFVWQKDKQHQLQPSGCYEYK